MQTVREVFGKGNDFATKITYSAKDPRGHLKAFRTSPAMRVAVTVDMIATGTDVKPLECVFFMRDVCSGQYFEQMKGRGAAPLTPQTFVPSTTRPRGTRFVIVDAIGVTEHDFVEPPLNREKSISLKKLLDKAATLNLTEDETATLASRLAALDRQLTPAERSNLTKLRTHRCTRSCGHSSMRSTSEKPRQQRARRLGCDPQRSCRNC